MRVGVCVCSERIMVIVKISVDLEKKSTRKCDSNIKHVYSIYIHTRPLR